MKSGYISPFVPFIVSVSLQVVGVKSVFLSFFLFFVAIIQRQHAVCRSLI